MLKISPTASGLRRVLADQAEAFLQLGGDGILEPEQAVGFEVLAEAGGLDRGQAVVDVVQQVDVVADGVAQLVRTALGTSGRYLWVAQTSSTGIALDHAAIGLVAPGPVP